MSTAFDDPTENKPQQPPQSYVQIVFKEYGSTIFEFRVGEQVSPLQMIAVGRYLQMLGEHQINQMMLRQDEIAQTRRLIVPGMDTEGLRL